MTRTTLTRRQLWRLFCVECGTAKPTPELVALGLVRTPEDAGVGFLTTKGASLLTAFRRQAEPDPMPALITITHPS